MSCLRALALVVLMVPAAAFAADDPFAEIRELIVARRHKEAREQLVKARDTFAAQSDGSNEAIAWLMLGVTDTSLGQGVAAKAELEEAVAKFTAVDDHFSAAMSLIAFATWNRSEGRLAEAIAGYERALAMLPKAAEPSSRLSLKTLEVLAPMSGISIDFFKPALAHPQMVKTMMLPALDVFTRDTYASALIEAGELQKAEEQLSRASASLFGSFASASIDQHFGDLRRRQWRLGEARESYTKALRSSEFMDAMSHGRISEDLSIFAKLAELELLTGHVEEALAWNDRALKKVRDSGDARKERAILEDRAGLLRTASRNEEAFALYEDVLALAIARDDLFREASIHADLGSLHMFRGNFGSAARHLEKAIELYQALHEPYIEAPLWILLAQVQIQLDIYDGANVSLDNACELAAKTGFQLASDAVDLTRKTIAPQGSNAIEIANEWFALPGMQTLLMGDVPPELLRDPWGLRSDATSNEESVHALAGDPMMLRAMRLFFQGKTLFERGDRDGARSTWMKALALNPGSDIQAGILGMIGASYWVEGKRDEGLEYFTRTASVLRVSADDIKIEEMLAGYFAGHRQWYFGLLIDMLLQDGKPWEAFAQAERARARAFLQTVGNHRLNAERGAEPRLVREAEILRTEMVAREQEAQQAHGEAAKRMNANLELMRQRYRTLLTRVKVSNPEYESLTNVEPLPMEDLRRELPADTALISYFLSPKVVNAWVIDSNQAHHVVLPLDSSGLERITCWARQFGPPVDVRGVKPLDACDGAATSEDAFDQLIAPLLSVIHHRKLVIVPHGVLHYVPFAALRNRQTERYLIDDYTLTYIPSASALRFLRAKESPVDGGALILGDPDNAMTRLPGAAEEASFIARRFGATAHLGDAARESLLYAANGKFDLVHLAAHGIYDPKNPLFSRIALARDETRDGSLTVDEILSTLDLTGVNLVVLSACQSAIGARSGGDEVVGLTRALLYAGTPGVISTLWNIDDAASAGLMREFYRRLAGGTSVAEALRQAQLAVKERFSNPKYWAAFVLTGDPQGRWRHAD